MSQNEKVAAQSIGEIISRACKNPECGHTQINHRRFNLHNGANKSPCFTFIEAKEDYCNCDGFKIS